MTSVPCGTPKDVQRADIVSRLPKGGQNRKTCKVLRPTYIYNEISHESKRQRLKDVHQLDTSDESGQFEGQATPALVARRFRRRKAGVPPAGKAEADYSGNDKSGQVECRAVGLIHWLSTKMESGVCVGRGTVCVPRARKID